MILRITFLSLMSPRRKYFLRAISLGVFLAAVFLSLNYFKDDSVLVGEILPGFPDDADVGVRFINNRGEIIGNAWGYDAAEKPYVYQFLWSEENGITNLSKLWGPDCHLAAMNDRGQFLTRKSRGKSDLDDIFFWSKETGMIDLQAPVLNEDLHLWMNAHGQVCGTSTAEESDTRSHFFWSQETDLTKIADCRRSDHIDGINQQGEVIGRINSKPFVWSKEKGMLNFPFLRKYDCISAINDRGQIVGTMRRGENQNGHEAFFWSEETGMIKLETPPELNSEAISINNHGQVVGILNSKDDKTSQAFFWSTATGMVKIHHSPVGFVFGLQMNDHGQIVGQYHEPNPKDPNDPDYLPFFWSLETGLKHLTCPDGIPENIFVPRINNQGTIVCCVRFKPPWWVRAWERAVIELDLPREYYPAQSLRDPPSKTVIWRVPPSSKTAKDSGAK